MAQEESVVLTREQLYEAVWAEPMSVLAPKYEFSDVGLAKVCRKMKIPLPGRGYWRQKEVGQKVRRPPLRKLPPGLEASLGEVQFRRSSSNSGTGEPEGPVAEQQRFEAIAENKVVVPEVLTDPHPLVA